MKHLFYCVSLICILVAACKNEKKEVFVQTVPAAQDTLCIESLKGEDSFERRPDVIYSEDIIVDTVINKFRISYVVKNNSSIIYYRHIDGNGDSVKYNYADRSVFLTLKYDDKIVFTNREFNKYTFSSYIPNEAIKDYELFSFRIKAVNGSEAIFYFNICMPDTDVCYLMGLTVDNNGTIGVREEEQYMESDSIF